MTTTDPHVRTRPRLDLTPQEFERRLAAHGHDDDEIRRLWEELAVAERGPDERRRLPGLGAAVALYLGLVLVVAASVSLLVVFWDDLAPGGVLALAGVYLVGYLVASEIARRRELVEAADVLEAAAVAWVAVVTYAAQELMGVWPEGAGDSASVHRGLTTIAVVAVAAGLLLLAQRPDPLLLVPIAAATAVLAVDVAELVFGAGIDDLGPRQLPAFVLPLGVAWLAVGLWLDATGRRAFATWAHWCGLVLVGAAVLALIPKTVPGFALVGVLGAIALFFSAFVRHWSYTVVGAVGVLIATAASIGELGRLAPAVIAVVGLALIVVALRWSRWRDSLRAAVVAWLPDRVQELVRRVAP